MKKKDNSQAPAQTGRTLHSLALSQQDDPKPLTGEEFLLLKGFRDLEPRFREMVLNTVSMQASRCIARRGPMLKLVASEGRARP